MKVKRRKPPEMERPPRLYRGADIPMRVIRRYARQIAEKFHPEKIILFGSYAYGTPHDDSDVDILVVMPCRNQLDQAVKIRWEFSAKFPMDLIVRKPSEIAWRLNERESFTTEIMTKGKVLYEKGDASLDGQGRKRLQRGRRSRPSAHRIPR